jgi:uncharacterized protein (TIGR02145 family)
LNYRKYLTAVPFLLYGLGLFAQETDSVAKPQEPDYFTDKRDKKTYKTVVIGKQTWMAENLAFNPGGGGYWAYNNILGNVEKYGYLYAYAVAINVCPKGWHLPSDDEWRQLTKYLGGEGVAGAKLKSADGWLASDSKGTDESGFSAIAGGYRDGYGTYNGLKEIGYWWTSTATARSVDYAWLRGLWFDKAAVGRFETFRPSGLSVRCIKNLTKQQLKELEQESEEIIDPFDE